MKCPHCEDTGCGYTRSILTNLGMASMLAAAAARDAMPEVQSKRPGSPAAATDRHSY
jgi:hypothetical protein